MSVLRGEKLTLSIFGTSHGTSIGMILDGLPPGIRIDEEALATFMARRAPGQSNLSTARKEPDHPEFISGIKDGMTTGEQIKAIIYNTDVKSSDYSALARTPRPGHADYTAHVKYKGHEDSRGGGAFSGRMTAPLCIAGGICKQILESEGIAVSASIHDIHGNSSEPLSEIVKAQALRDSVGGTVICTVSGLAAGYGGPLFEGLEGRLSQAIFGIPAVKGIEFGAGFGAAEMYGSENNDEFYYDAEGNVRTRTNNCGGILGGISDGMDIEFRVAIKPTPSIARVQRTIIYDSREETEIEVHGRHDPCIVPRALPCIEAATAIVLVDVMLSQQPGESADIKSEYVQIENSDKDASTAGQAIARYGKACYSINSDKDASTAGQAASTAPDEQLDGMLNSGDSGVQHISDCRSEIDAIDSQLLPLIEQRLRVAEAVAIYKQEHNLEIVDQPREDSLFSKLQSRSSRDLADLNKDIFKAIINASCKHQKDFITRK